MKKIISVILLIIFVAAIIFGMPYITEFFSDNDTQGENVEFVIEGGESVSSIAKRLKENNLIKNENVFVLKVKLDNVGQKIQKGTFSLNTGMSLKTLINTLITSGLGKSFTLTIPEGYSIEQIAKKLENMGILSYDEFISALDYDYDYEFLNNIPKKDYKLKLQGFLFPQTYEFLEDVTAYQIIDTLLSEFEKQYSQIGDVKNISYDTIILASLIERESKLDSERDTIAGVIKNRLNKDMLLQIDASVVYFLSDGLYNVDKVYYKDLEKDSLYNTYKYKGLPIGPICNPGIKSIKAALMPKHHDYLYYHTDEAKKDGSHIFTKNYEEHLNTQN